MKRKNIGTLLATFVVVGVGGVCLALSISQIMGAIQKSQNEGIVTLADSAEQITFPTESEDIDSTKIINELKRNVDRDVKLFGSDNVLEDFYEVLEVSYVYDGKIVYIKDGRISAEEQLDNAEKIMDFIYGYVDETILTPYGIDKSEYEYEIKRQYWRDDITYYGVTLWKDDKLKCSIGVGLDEEPTLISFSRDGLVEMAGIYTEIPEEYLIKNWCATTEQREAIYNEYYEESKKIIENDLGLAAIRSDIKDMDSATYFSVDDIWSIVIFGYVLEDNMYVKVFYNKVNGQWDGFAIAGYYEGQ